MSEKMSVGEYLDFCFIPGRSKTKSKGTYISVTFYLSQIKQYFSLK